MEFIAVLIQGVLGLAIVFAIIYSFVKAALEPVHSKLDRLLANQDDLAKRIDALERDNVRSV